MFKAIKEFFVGKPVEAAKEVVAEVPYKVEVPATKVEVVNATPVVKAETVETAPAKTPAKAPAAKKAPAKKPAGTKPAAPKQGGKRKPKK
jgi:hypothetical protein